MITVSKQENGVLFTFENSDKYLYSSGTIEVPFNSLSIIQDESDNITLRKSASWDIFLSARYDTDFGYASKEEAVNALKEILYDEAGISEEEVQQMIDAATSGIPSSEVIEQLRTDVNAVSGTVSSHTADTNVHFSGTQKSNYDGLEGQYYVDDSWDIMPESVFNHWVSSEWSVAMGQFDQRITANASAVTELESTKLDASAYTPTDLSQYWTSGQTQEAINAATSGIPSSQVIEQLQTDVSDLQGETQDIWDTIDEKEEVIASALTQLNQDVADIDAKEEVIASALTEIRQGVLFVNFDDLMENMNDDKWDELINALQNNKPIFAIYNGSEENITNIEQMPVDGYVYIDQIEGEETTEISLKQLNSGGYMELYIVKNGSEDYEVSDDSYDYQPSLQAGSGIIIDEDNVISVTVDSELDETSNNPVANSAITNAIINNEYTVSQAINSLNNRVTAVESGGTGGGITSGEVQTMIDDSLDIYWTSAQTQTAIDAAGGYLIDLDTIMQRGLTDAEWDGTIEAITNNRLIYIKTEGYLCTLQSYHLNGNEMTLLAASDNFASIYTVTKLGSNQYSLSNANKQYVSQAEKDAWNAKVDTSAITTAITSGSTDSEIPTAKATYDAIQAGGGGGMDNDTQQLISTAFNDLNDRKADLTELSKYQKKGDYVVTSTLADYMTNASFDEYATAKERIISGALNDLDNRVTAVESGLKLVKLTQAEYDALATKDSSTLYIISD